MDGGKNIKTDGTCLDEPFLMRRGKVRTFFMKFDTTDDF